MWCIRLFTWRFRAKVNAFDNTPTVADGESEFLRIWVLSFSVHCQISSGTGVGVRSSLIRWVRPFLQSLDCLFKSILLYFNFILRFPAGTTQRIGLIVCTVVQTGPNDAHLAGKWPVTVCNNVRALIALSDFHFDFVWIDSNLKKCCPDQRSSCWNHLFLTLSEDTGERNKSLPNRDPSMAAEDIEILRKYQGQSTFFILALSISSSSSFINWSPFYRRLKNTLDFIGHSKTLMLFDQIVWIMITIFLGKKPSDDIFLKQKFALVVIFRQEAFIPPKTD